MSEEEEEKENLLCCKWCGHATLISNIQCICYLDIGDIVESDDYCDSYYYDNNLNRC